MTSLETLAAMWTHGLEAARMRLRLMLENGDRFDARDRQALAYVLTRGDARTP